MVGLRGVGVGGRGLSQPEEKNKQVKNSDGFHLNVILFTQAMIMKQTIG